MKYSNKLQLVLGHGYKNVYNISIHLQRNPQWNWFDGEKIKWYYWQFIISQLHNFNGSQYQKVHKPYSTCT